VCSGVVVSIIYMGVGVDRYLYVDAFPDWGCDGGASTARLSGMRDQGDSCIGCAMVMRMFGKHNL
jgi:hypothetical protein